MALGAACKGLPLNCCTGEPSRGTAAQPRALLGGPFFPRCCSRLRLSITRCGRAFLRLDTTANAVRAQLSPMLGTRV
jgi:hypothetical protein